MTHWIPLAMIAGAVVGALLTLARLRRAFAAERERLLNEANSERERARLEAERAQLRLETLRERLDHANDERDRVEATFRGLAADVLGANTREFRGQAERSLQGLLQPLALELRTFREAVQLSGKESFALRHQVEHLGRQSAALSEQAQQLSTALTGDLRVQGAWGELMLERVLELSGLERGREFELQHVLADGDGVVRPDAVLLLPDNRQLVIDAKVSLTAYERYANATEAEPATQALEAHVLSLRTHLRQLAAKNYGARVPGRGLDFVLMFVPLEAALVAALRQAPELLGEAHRLGVLPVTPSTLLVAVRTIEHLWRGERQQRNAQAIAERAGRLYDKFVAFVEDLGEVGRRIEQARSAHERALTKLTRGRGNLARQCETLREMGASSRHQLPLELLEPASPDEERALEPQVAAAGRAANDNTA